MVEYHVHMEVLMDVCYLELAQRLNLPLLTFGSNMTRAGNDIGIQILGGKNVGVCCFRFFQGYGTGNSGFDKGKQGWNITDPFWRLTPSQDDLLLARLNGKRRPVLIIQNDVINRSAIRTTICADNFECATHANPI